MKIAQIKDIAQLADGTVVGQMTVQIAKAFPPKVGEGKFGPWRVQNCVLKDGTGEIKASFWLPDEMKDLVGQTVTIKSQAGAKGLQGLNVSTSKHSGENELKITDKAAIIDQAGEKSVQIKFPTGNVPPPVAMDKGEARKAIFNNAKLYVECVKATTWISSQIDQMSESHFQAAVASMFISAERAGIARAFAEIEKPVEKAPEPTAESDLSDDDLKW